MKFTVLWSQLAQDDLAELWLNATDRNAISKAASKIDTVLKSDPLNCGESREAAVRIAFVPPLGIDFEVFPDDRVVQILAIWRIQS